MSGEATRILVVDDEASITDAVGTALRYEGFEVRMESTGRGALDVTVAFRPHLIVLDVMLPDLDGLEVTRRLRSDGIRTPVLFLTARDATEDKVSGLTVGGDDYVTKPFSLAEVVARVRAVLRRTAISGERDGLLEFEDLVMDEETREVWRNGTPVHLTATEFNLLRYFLLNPRRVLSKAQILDHVWQYDFGGEANVVETYGAVVVASAKFVGRPQRAHSWSSGRVGGMATCPLPPLRSTTTRTHCARTVPRRPRPQPDRSNRRARLRRPRPRGRARGGWRGRPSQPSWPWPVQREVSSAPPSPATLRALRPLAPHRRSLPPPQVRPVASTWPRCSRPSNPRSPTSRCAAAEAPDRARGWSTARTASCSPTPERLVSGNPAGPVAFLGVSTSDDPSAATGATIAAVTPGSPADAAGLGVDDVIVAVDGKTVSGAADLGRRIAGYAPGDTVELAVLTDGREREVRAQLGQRPAGG